MMKVDHKAHAKVQHTLGASKELQSQMKNSKVREYATVERKIRQSQERRRTWKTVGEGGSAWLEKVDLTSGERRERSNRSGLRREPLSARFSRNSYNFAVVKCELTGARA